MIWALLLLQAAQKPWEKDWFADAVNPFDQFDEKPAELGPGPHTLVIAVGPAITRMDYKSGASCGKARDAVLNQGSPLKPGEVYVARRTIAFCVPR